jgi:tetratricopeptide (TPR) repeat protein
MNTTRTNELWQIYVTKGKCCYSTGYAAQAAQLFHRAEEVAATFDPSDVRRGVSYSWLALCYFNLANYTIAEDMFRRAEHIYSFSLESTYRKELGANLSALGAFAKQTGILPGAREYHRQHDVVAEAIEVRPTSSTKGPRTTKMLRTGVQRMRTMGQFQKESQPAVASDAIKAESAAKKLFKQLRSMCQEPQPILSASGRTVIGYS